MSVTTRTTAQLPAGTMMVSRRKGLFVVRIVDCKSLKVFFGVGEHCRIR